MTLTIYGVMRSRASRNVWLALEAGIPFEHVPVIQHYRTPGAAAPQGMWTTQSPEFLAINPNGLIPCVKDGDLVLNESLAINLYLAGKQGGPVGPESMAEGGLMAQWTLWAATNCEPHTIQILYHRLGNAAVPVKDESKALAAIEALRRPFAVLDAELARSEFLVGGRFTVADINVAEVLRYARPAPELFAAAPNVDRWLNACHQRRPSSE